MKKILFAINKFAVGGAERLVVNQANYLNEKDFSVFVVTFFSEKENSIKRELLVPQTSQVFISFRGFFDLAGYYRLIAFLKREQFNVIITNLFFTNTVVRIAVFVAFLFDAKKPVVVAYEHNIYRYKEWRHFFVDWMLSFTTTKIIAVSEAVKRFLVIRGCISAKKIVVLHNGVLIPVQCVLSREEARKKYGIPESIFLILSVGRVTQQKGYEYLIEATAMLSEQGMKNILFLIIGAEEQKLSVALRANIQKKKLSETLRFLGPMDHCDVVGYLSAADVFCMPSLWEGFGIAAVEAMMLGKPVVASNIDGLREIVYHGEDGLLVPPRNAKALADAISRLAGDKAFLVRCAGSAKEHALFFSFDGHIRRFEELLANLQSLNV